MFLPGFVFGLLCVVQVESADFTNHKSLHTCLVTFFSYQVSFFCNVQLLCLIIEVCHQLEDVLIEIHLFLTDFGEHHFTIALGYLHFAATLSPVENGDFHAYLDNLVVQQILIGRGELMILSGIAHTGKQVDAPQVSTCSRHFIISFQLAAAYILCK